MIKVAARCLTSLNLFTKPKLVLDCIQWNLLSHVTSGSVDLSPKLSSDSPPFVITHSHFDLLLVPLSLSLSAAGRLKQCFLSPNFGFRFCPRRIISSNSSSDFFGLLVFGRLWLITDLIVLRRNRLFVFMSGQGNQPDGPTCSARIAPFDVSLRISSTAILMRNAWMELSQSIVDNFYLVRMSSLVDCSLQTFFVFDSFWSVFGVRVALTVVFLIENLLPFGLWFVDILVNTDVVFVWCLILLLGGILKSVTWWTYKQRQML